MRVKKKTNFHSWGSGANPWGDERDDKFSKPNHWDGMLEVVGVTGVVHLGQIQSGLRSAIRIIQVSHGAAVVLFWCTETQLESRLHYDCRYLVPRRR